MPEIVIDEEFKRLLPPLDKHTYTMLEDSILQNGCMHPLVLWNDILIDGHNRYEILTKHGLDFDTISMEFDSRDEVLIWIISTQVSRRNLTPMQLAYFRGLHFNADKRLVTNESGKNQFGEVVRQNDGQPKGSSTAKRLAEQYNVSSRTIERDARIAVALAAIGEVSPDAKREILSGATRINRKHLQELAAGTEDDIIDVAMRIDDGTFERRKAANPATPESMDLESLPDEMHPLTYDIIKVTSAFNADLQRLTQGSDATQLRTTLRSHIETLEGLYGQIG